MTRIKFSNKYMFSTTRNPPQRLFNPVRTGRLTIDSSNDSLSRTYRKLEYLLQKRRQCADCSSFAKPMDESLSRVAEPLWCLVLYTIGGRLVFHGLIRKRKNEIRHNTLMFERTVSHLGSVRRCFNTASVYDTRINWVWATMKFIVFVNFILSPHFLRCARVSGRPFPMLSGIDVIRASFVAQMRKLSPLLVPDPARFTVAANGMIWPQMCGAPGCALHDKVIYWWRKFLGAFHVFLSQSVSIANSLSTMETGRHHQRKPTIPFAHSTRQKPRK